MEPLLYKIVRPIIKFLFFIVFRPTVIGKENIDASSNVVLAGNHTSNLDCLLLISVVKRPIHFLGKHTLFKGPKGCIFKGMGVIPVDRTKKRNPEAMNSAVEVLNHGSIVGIFPEGTINKTDDVIMPFKMGAVKMASVTNSKIVPFIITGKYQALRRNITVEFCKPIKIGDDLEKENNKLMRIVSSKLKENC